MVVRSGSESIVGYDRERIRGYRIGGLVVLSLALANLAIGVDEAAGYSRWWDRILALVPYAIYMAPAVFIGLKCYKAGRVLSQAFVAVGPQGVRLHLLAKKGFTYVPLPEQNLKWEEIRDISFDGRFCRFRVGGHLYTLNDHNSPSPLTVAQLMADRMGVQLPAQALLLASGKRPMPRLKQAAMAGGVGLALIGVVVAEGWRLYSHAPASYDWPYYKAEFLTLVVLGLLGFISFFTAITLALVELNHRL
jgi:hypothetical protein